MYFPLTTAQGFAEYMRAERLRQNITQEALAATVGKSRSWVYDVENSNKMPTLPAVLDVIQALGGRAAIDTGHTGQSGSSAPTEPGESIIDELFRTLDQDDRLEHVAQHGQLDPHSSLNQPGHGEV